MSKPRRPQVHATGQAEVRHLESYDIRRRHLIGVTSDVNSGQSKRKRQDSGLQLRWPNANDSRRAIVGEAPANMTTGHIYTSESRFVHVSPRDVEMHYRLTASGAWRKGELFPFSVFEINCSDNLKINAPKRVSRQP